MPRDIPVGNGDLLITFDQHYHVRDLYYPLVGRYNHTGGHVQRFGVWVDGRFSWLEDEAWQRDLRYKPDTLVTEVRLTHPELGVELTCNDAVDFSEPVYFRRVSVRDLAGRDREVRVFFHYDFSIKESPVGDTADYDPESVGLVFYKDDSYFLVNGCDQHKCGIDHWAIGTKRVGGAEGTWRDAEDGKLGRNAISQGSVDATVGFDLLVPAGGQASMSQWIACGNSYESVRALNRFIWKTGPERLLARTEAYWRLWALKEPVDLSPLPRRLRDLYVRSMLVVRTQIDNRGAIIAANDSDVAHFAGDHYSYCWPRDGALVAHALTLAGQSELSRQFFRYCARVINKNGYFLHKYTPAGHLGSSWHPWLIDGKAVLPIQQDETALVLWSLRQHFEAFRDVEFIKPIYQALIVQPANWMLDYRDASGLPKPSWDLWEERRGVHTFTVAATIGALRAAARFAADFGEPDKAAAYSDAAARMRTALARNFWDASARRCARLATPLPEGGYRLDMTRDSANFALFAFGAFEASDPLVVSEMESLRHALWIKTDVGGCARYERDYFHQVERDKVDDVPGNPWVICTLWHALHAIARATILEELAEALPLLEWAASRARPSGVLAEQFHPYTGAPMSVSPLTWSHATVMTVTLEYLRKHQQLLAEANSPGGYAGAGVA
ncbi:MAG TPA: glycoside hydrolase family 15 protein [Phycisphaerales bacterium]|nr:glycoside hydrolase family 15 protein [Phycisphaerales bacterium]